MLNLTQALYWILASGVLAVVYGIVLIAWILRQKPGDKKMTEIAIGIQEGASAYLNRQYSVVGLVGAIIAVVLYSYVSHLTAIGFVVGAVASAAAGYIGMNVAVRANVRTTDAA